MRQIAFVTYGAASEINSDDRLAADVLQSHGIEVVPAVWDDPHVNWPAYAAVVVRSAWDYHLHVERYAGWLRHCTAARVNFWNPPAAILANLSKRYLLDLERQGIYIVPTVAVERGTDQPLGAILEQRDWNAAVVKPAVSASAQGTWRTSLPTSGHDQARFQEQLGAQDLLVQPLVPEIAAQGEWSLLFFANEFSHAVLKQPAAGDFRVQREYGGQSRFARPPSGLVEQAQTILAKAAGNLLYARVDGIERGGQFILMELEINEPLLFLGYAAEAAQRFAAAIRKVL